MSPRSRTRRRTHPKPAAPTPSPAGRKGLLRRILGSKAAGWLLCALIAVGHAFLLELAPYQESTVAFVYPVLVVAPGIVSMLLLRGEWKHFYRWAAVLGLAICCYPDVIPAAVAIGTCWALHRAWFTERTGPLLLRRGPKAKAAAQAA